MMKLNRYALVAGLLALGAAACGDDVEIVQPTPEPPPPPPPVEATMAPASASVAVGNSVVFAVNASGGVAGEAASWTCASSNTGIATVSSTSAGCSATGVAAGDVTITASVTKSGETVNVGAQLTVTSDEAPPQPAGDPAFLVVASIEGEGDTDASGLKGRVSVTLNVERGDQDLEGLALLVDGETVASQSFGSGMDMGMTPPDEAAEQAVHAFTMSFDSDGYDEHGDHVDVDYMNGEHTIAAELEIGATMADGMHGHETISSNVVTVEFDNDDGYIVTADLGDNTALDDDGRVWYGGPDNGDVVISALGVSYSGAETGEAIVRLEGCEAEEDDEFDCDGQQGDREISVISGGVEGTILNADDLPEANIDMEGPDAPNFYPNPNKREDGWVNASVNFTGENGTGSKKDGWLVYNDESADDGVGGYSPRIRFAEADSDKEVGVALASPALPALVLPAALAGQSSKADAFCVVASAVDMLGNESDLPDADEDCVSHDAYATTTGTGEDATTTYAAGLLAGADLAPPTIAFSPASPKADATMMRNFQVQLADVGSGIRATDPVTAEAHVRDADESDEIDPLGLNVELPLATTTGLPGDMGYYTFSASTTDKAGNSSGEVMRTALHDTTVPVTNTIVGAYDTKTGSYSLIATVTDNLSIKEYWAEMRYAASPGDLTITNNLFLPREGGVAVDAYNADDLTKTTLASSFMAHAFQAIQTGAGITNLTSIGVFARDNAGGVSAGALGDGAGGAVTITPALALTVADNGFDISADALPGADGSDADDRKVFQTLVAAAGVKSEMVELKATATGTLFTAPTPAVLGDNPATTDVVETDFEITAAVDGVQGLRDNPISRVDFYAAVNAEDGGNGRTALKYIGSVNGATAGAEDFDTEGSAAGIDSRRYIYELKMSAADFLAIVGGDDDYGADDDNDTVDDTDGAIIAIGVGDNENVGFSSSAVELTVEEK